MVKECRVILNNDCVTVVVVDGVEVQFPSIRRNAKTVYVKSDSGKYSIVDELTESNNTAEEKVVASRARKKYSKKTTVEDETIVDN
jgi:hypothetical protein